MFINYLKIAIRNLKKYKWYSFINIGGLTVGMTCFILIFLFIRYELSYDSFHENVDRIYRLCHFTLGKPSGIAPAPLGPAFARDYSEVLDYVRVHAASNRTEKVNIRYEEKSFNENRFFVTDPSIFRVFTFPLVKGDPNHALNDPNAVVITEAVAEKYFGDEDPMGKAILYENRYTFTVSGVAANCPPNSHFHFDFLVSFKNHPRLLGERYDELWNSSNFVTYFLLDENASPEGLLQKAAANADHYPIYEREKFLAELYLEPLRHIHLATTRMNFEPSFEKKYILLLGLTGLFILLIACINFINLSTAQSSKRIKEVGLRKVVGATRSSLIKQFLSESVLIAFIALAIATILSIQLIEWYNAHAGINMASFNFNRDLMMALVFTILVVGVVSGSYPAFYVSAFRPVFALKGMKQLSKYSLVFRNLLVVFQFMMSIILIVVTLTIRNQIDFMRNMDLGWEKERMVHIPLYDTEAKKDYKLIKRAFLNHPGVVSASASAFKQNQLRFRHGAKWEGKQSPEITWVWVLYVDHDFLQTFKLEVVEGRGFDKQFLTDEKGSYMLNEAAVKEIGWQSPIGKQFTGFGNDAYGPVIGVVKDFHFRSFHHEIEPLFLYVNPERFEYLSVRLSPENLTETLDYLETKWKQFVPGLPFEYRFFDDEFDTIYRSETTMNGIIGQFTGLSIFIACLGLFGLAAFVTQQRTKEIGIRKVLGASVFQIISMLSKDFLKWVVLANLIAWPVAWYAMDRWLRGFAYRTSMGIWTFVLSALIALVIACITVSFQSIRTALANPVDSLKYE